MPLATHPKHTLPYIQLTASLSHNNASGRMLGFSASGDDEATTESIVFLAQYLQCLAPFPTVEPAGPGGPGTNRA